MDSEDANALLNWMLKNTTPIDKSDFGSSRAIKDFVAKENTALLPKPWEVNQMLLDDLLIYECKYLPTNGSVFKITFYFNFNFFSF